ncbi:ferredoxin-type protein NapF [Iodobacter ciconiae]|uniref:Ferredoxin-type protein NapF n=1 Tax=Iodobacter ciconiae TaxID=2496266 RepID=A0A3S8ZSM8_9NEIS|nr:ferredoxin-type protein NapF [Iodobacter ciconiae]AZN36476.1 ferredoxin-type protein NapF [Iodobacter ciconiae]
MDHSRRNLLFGRRPQAPVAPRPPWATAHFLDRCTHCGDCSAACPTQIIKVGDGGFPVVDFTQAECSFCGECTQVCTSLALDQSVSPPWRIHAKINESCLAERGVECRICGEACGEQAIRFQLAVGKVAHPFVNAEQCTGCGACVSSCPSQSIRLLELVA